MAILPTTSLEVDDASQLRGVILVLPLMSLSDPLHLSPPIASLSRFPNLSRLLVILVSPIFAPTESGGMNMVEHWNDIQRLLAVTYVEGTREGQQRGKMDMVVDVLLEKEIGEEMWNRVSSDGTWDALYTCDGVPLNIPSNCRLSSLEPRIVPTPELSESPNPHDDKAIPSSHSAHHDTTALGGTFDHLHAGHKILLSAACLITSRKLIVGLTDPSLLKNKAHAELVESIEERQENVQSFLKFFRPSLEYELVSISDVAGPTGWDPDIQALVVSYETMSGADAIAKIRQAKSMPPLTVYVIDVISSEEASLPHEDAERLKKTKLSSTLIREWLAQKRK